MMLLTHALIGAGLSLNQKSLPEEFIIPFVSHFLLDGLPHNDYIYFAFNAGNRKNASTSLLSLLILILTVFVVAVAFLITNNPAIPIGAFAAALPDLLSACSKEFKTETTLFDKFHFLLHTKSSLAEILLQKIGRVPIRRAETIEEAERNYKTISGNTWGKIGWAAELLLEFSILLLGLKMVVA